MFSAALDTAYSQTSPDTISFTFIGITACRKCILLDERVYNNAELTTPLSPSDIPPEFVRFLELNRKRYGFSRDVYIDSADQATITECQKYKWLTGCIYSFKSAAGRQCNYNKQGPWSAYADRALLQGAEQMKYPLLVPDSVCKTPVTVQRTEGLNRDGSLKNTVIYSGKCFYSEKTYQKLTADKQLVTLSGEALFNGDIAPDADSITGSITLLHGITRNIYASQKCRNPDGTVNYTRLELI